MNVVIVHGCPSKDWATEGKPRTYNGHWMPWTSQELVSHDIKVETPTMPEPWKPSYESFKKEFEKCEITEDTVLVGHSCGCAFLVRWLGESKQKIKKLILVAPWKIPDKQDEYRPAFYNYPIDKGIQARVGEIIMFTADDEEEDGKKSLKMYHDALGGEVIELKGRGHYTFDDMKTEEFPELRDAILEEEDEEDEEEDEEESDKKSDKAQKLRSMTKNAAMLAATAVMSAVVGAAAGFTICQNSKTAPTPTPSSAVSTTKPAPSPAPAAGVLPRSTPSPAPTPAAMPTPPPAAGSATTPPPTPPVEPPIPPPSSDGTTP